MQEEELRELAGPSSRADDDTEVTQFYINPIAKPIPQGRSQTSLQDTINDLNMHKPARNGLEVCSLRSDLDLLLKCYVVVIKLIQEKSDQPEQQLWYFNHQVHLYKLCLVLCTVQLMILLFFLQLSSDDVSASLGEESLQEERDEEQQEQQSPHPAGQRQ